MKWGRNNEKFIDEFMTVWLGWTVWTVIQLPKFSTCCSETCWIVNLCMFFCVWGKISLFKKTDVNWYPTSLHMGCDTEYFKTGPVSKTYHTKQASGVTCFVITDIVIWCPLVTLYFGLLRSVISLSECHLALNSRCSSFQIVVFPVLVHFISVFSEEPAVCRSLLEG